jgi:hypothetical protein
MAQRLAHEVAAQFGVSVEDLRDKGDSSNKRLKEARKVYADGLKDGSVIDPPAGGTVVV